MTPEQEKKIVKAAELIITTVESFIVALYIAGGIAGVFLYLYLRK